MKQAILITAIMVLLSISCVTAATVSHSAFEVTPGSFQVGSYYFPSGNVGIGTTSPGDALEIKANNAGGRLIVLDRTGHADVSNKFAIGIGDSGVASGNKDFMFLGKSGTADVVINEDGNIGIGTTSPSAKLEVAGNIRSNNLGLIYSYTQGTSAEIIDVPNTSDTGLYYVVVEHGAYGSGIYHTWVMFYRMQPYTKEVLTSDSDYLAISKHIGSQMNVLSIRTGATVNALNAGQNIHIELGSNSHGRAVKVFKLF